jgi:hypothetical protein
MLNVALYLVVSRKQDSPAPLSHKSSIESYFVALLMISGTESRVVLALMSILLFLEVVVSNVIVLDLLSIRSSFREAEIDQN